MAAVLSQWCNDGVRLSRRVSPTSLEADFANGFLLAELLAKHNQLPLSSSLLPTPSHSIPAAVSFPASFRDDARAESVIANFAALEPTFARLGVALNARTVAALVRRRPHVAQALLYRLKTQLAVLERVVVGRAPADGAKALARLQQRLPKPAFETMSSAVFSRALHDAAGADPQRNRDMAALLSRFTRDALARHVAEIDAYNRAEMSARRNFLDHFRSERLRRMAGLYAAERARLEAGAREWSRNLTLRHAEERQRRYAAKRLGAEQASRRRAGREADVRAIEDGTAELAALAAVHCIVVEPDAQELERQRVGLAPPSSVLNKAEYNAELAARLGPEGGARPLYGRTSVGSAGATAFAAAGTSAGVLSTLLPTGSEALLPDASAVYGAGLASLSEAAVHASTYRASEAATRHALASMQARKGAETAAAATRSRRRRNVLAGLELVTEHALHVQRVEQLKTAALVPAIPEVALTGVVSSVLKAERAFVARREELDAYEAQRRSATNWGELERQRRAFADFRARHDAAVQLACFTYDQCVAECARAKQARTFALASVLAQKLVDFAIEVARARELLRGRTGPIVRLSHGGFDAGKLLSHISGEEKDSELSPSEPDDGERFVSFGEYGISSSMARDLEVIFASDFPMRAAAPIVSEHHRPLAVPGALDVDSTSDAFSAVDAAVREAGRAKKAIESAAAIAAVAPTESASATVAAAVTVAAAALSASSEVLPDFDALLRTETPASLVSAAGVRGDPQHELDDEGRASAAAAAESSGSPSSIFAPLPAEAREAAQCLLDACALRDYIVGTGPWASDAPDLQGAHLELGTVNVLEAHVSRLLRADAAASAGQAGLPAIFPHLFPNFAPPLPSVPAPAPVPPPASVQPSVSLASAVLPSIAGGKAPAGRRASVTKTAPVPEPSSAPAPEPAPAISTEARTVVEAEEEVDPFSTDGFAGANIRASKVATVLSAAVDAPRADTSHINGSLPSVSLSVPSASTYSDSKDKISLSNRLLGSTFVQFALTHDVYAASDVLGLVVRNVREAANSVADQAPDHAAARFRPRNAIAAELTRDSALPFRFPLTVSLVGPPHSGLLTQAARLADAFSLAVIHPRALMQRGVALAWPSSPQFRAALSNEQGSRPSSRSGVLSAQSHVQHATQSSSAQWRPSKSGSVAAAPLFLVPANDQRAHETVHGIRRPHKAAPLQAHRVSEGGSLNSASLESAPPPGAPAPRAPRSGPAGHSHALGSEGAPHTARVFGIVMQTDDAPSNVPPALQTTIPVDARLCAPVFDAALRRLGEQVLASPAHVPMDGGAYTRDVPTNALHGTVDAHVDWRKLPDDLVVQCVVGAIDFLANASGAAARARAITPAQASGSSLDGSADEGVGKSINESVPFVSGGGLHGIRGWILVGCPASKAQASALEKALTGFEEKPPLPKPLASKLPPGLAARMGTGMGVVGAATAAALASGDPNEPAIHANDIRRSAAAMLHSVLPPPQDAEAAAAERAREARADVSSGGASLDPDARAGSHVFEARSPGLSAGVEDTPAFWARLLAPAPAPAGLAVDAKRFDVSWASGIDCVLRVETTPDRLLRRALGWVVDAPSLTSAAVWQRSTQQSGARALAHALELPPITLASVEASSSEVAAGQQMASFPPHVAAISSPECPIASVLIAHLGVDLPEQVSLAAPGSSAALARAEVEAAATEAAAAAHAAAAAVANPSGSGFLLMDGAGLVAGAAGTVGGIAPPSPTSMLGTLHNESSIGSYYGGQGIERGLHINSSHLSAQLDSPRQAPSPPDIHSPAPHLPFVYHADAAPPHFLHESCTTFVPLAAADLAYRPGADGSLVSAAGQVDIEALGASIARDAEAWDAEIPAVDSFFSRGGLLRVVRAYTHRRGPVAAPSGGRPRRDERVNGAPALLAVAAVDDMVAGGGSDSRLRSSSMGPEDTMLANFSDAADASALGNVADMTFASGEEGSESDAEGDLQAPLEDAAEGRGAELDEELDGDSFVNSPARGFPRRGRDDADLPMQSKAYLPTDSAAAAASGAERVTAVPMPPATAGEWIPSRFDTFNEHELFLRLRGVLRAALREKREADDARVFARVQALAAVGAEAEALAKQRLVASKVRSGEGIAAAEAVARFAAERAAAAAEARRRAELEGEDEDEDSSGSGALAAGGTFDPVAIEGAAPAAAAAAAADPLLIQPSAEHLVFRNPSTQRIAPPPLPKAAFLNVAELSELAAKSAAEAAASAQAAADVSAAAAKAQAEAVAVADGAKGGGAKGVSFAGSGIGIGGTTAIGGAVGAASAVAIASQASSAAATAAAERLQSASADPEASLASVLACEWDATVAQFTRSARAAMRGLRVAEAAGIARLAVARRRVREFAARPCPELQLPISAFARQWNDAGLSSLFTAGSSRELGALAGADALARSGSAAAAVRAEWLVRLEETLQAMWDGVDHREGEGLARLASLAADGWATHSQAAVVRCFVQLVRAEVRRFAGVRRLLLDYYGAAEGARVAFDDFVGDAVTAAEEAAMKEAEVRAESAARAALAKPKSAVGSRRSSVVAAAPAPAPAPAPGVASKPSSAGPRRADDTKSSPAGSLTNPLPVVEQPATVVKIAPQNVQTVGILGSLLPPIAQVEPDGVDEAALKSSLDPLRLRLVFAKALGEFAVIFDSSSEAADPAKFLSPPSTLAVTVTALKDPPPPTLAWPTGPTPEEIAAKERAEAAAKAADEAAKAIASAPGKGAKPPSAAAKPAPASAKAGKGAAPAVPAPEPAPAPASPPPPAPSPSKPSAPELPPAARALFGPMQRLVASIRAAAAVADSVIAATEAMAVAQARARERRINMDRVAVRSALSRAIAEAASAKVAADEAELAASLAAAKAAKDRAVKVSGGSGAGAAQSMRLVGSKKEPPAVTLAAATAAVSLTIDVPAVLATIAPHLSNAALQLQAGRGGGGTGAESTTSDSASSPTLSAPSLGVAAFVDEGLFVALRYEASRFRANLAVLLRHCAAGVARIARRAEACWRGAHTDIMRASLAEGACVEAFGSFVRAAVLQGRPLLLELRIKQSADCAAFLVERGARVFASPFADPDAAALPGTAPIIERGDMTAADAHDADDERAGEIDSALDPLDALLLGLSPSQVALVASCLRETAIAYTSDASGPFGAHGVAPTSTIPLPFFVDALTRLGASGMLPARWALAAVEAAGGPNPASNTDSAPPLLLQLGERFRVFELAAGTAAAAAAAAGDSEAATVDNVVEWRLFVSSLCVSGPAPDLMLTVPVPRETGVRAAAPARESPLEAALHASARTHKRPSPNTTVGKVIFPPLLSVSSGIAQPPTPAEVLALYDAATGRASRQARGEEDDAELREASSHFEAALVPRAEVERCAGWWFLQRNIRETVAPSESESHAVAGDEIGTEADRLQPWLRDGATREDEDVLGDAGVGVHAPLDSTTALDGTSAPFSGWHHVAPSAASAREVLVSARASMRAVAAGEAGKDTAGVLAAAAAAAQRSSDAGDAAIRAVLLDTFAISAGAVYPDEAVLKAKGLRPEDSLVDVSSLCLTLMKIARRGS